MGRWTCSWSFRVERLGQTESETIAKNKQSSKDPNWGAAKLPTQGSFGAFTIWREIERGCEVCSSMLPTGDSLAQSQP